MTARLVLFLLGSWLLACGDEDPRDDAPPGRDAGAADAGPTDAGPAPACLPSSEAIMLPTPAWGGGDGGLTPPEGDLSIELLRPRPGWAPQLARLSGWPRRPTIVVPLWGRGVAVDGAAITLFGGEPLAPIDAPLAATLEDGGASLRIVPEDPLPAALSEVVVVLGPGAVEEAAPVPACGDGGEPHPGYAGAASRLPAGTDAALAFAFPLASIDRELPALYAALRARPALAVRSVGAVDAATLGEAAPSPEVMRELRVPIAEGLLDLPAYQDTGGAFTVDGAGVPVAGETTSPGFTVLRPAVGSAPYPFVLYQHGGSQHRRIAMQAVAPLLAAGYAVIALDLPFHGDRAPASGGTDFDILAFDDPLRSRDNLRQASADHLAVFTGLAALNEGLAPVFGDPETLDASRAHYVGLSLGGITGSLTFASATEVRAAALFVAGGGYQEILSEGLFSLVLGDVIRASGARRHAVLALVEALLNGADPLAYAAREAAAGRTRPLLLFEAIDDPIVPNGATDRWARAFGASLARPTHHSVLGVSAVALPHAADPTRLLVHCPMAEVPVGERHGALIQLAYAQELVARCFASLASDGRCEALDTGFAER